MITNLILVITLFQILFGVKEYSPEIGDMLDLFRTSFSENSLDFIVIHSFGWGNGGGEIKGFRVQIVIVP